MSRLPIYGLEGYGQRMRVPGREQQKHSIVSWGWFPMTRIKQVVGYGDIKFLLLLSLGKVGDLGVLDATPHKNPPTVA